MIETSRDDGKNSYGIDQTRKIRYIASYINVYILYEIKKKIFFKCNYNYLKLCGE